jgi:hypothetical protein
MVAKKTKAQNPVMPTATNPAIGFYYSNFRPVGTPPRGSARTTGCRFL